MLNYFCSVDGNSTRQALIKKKDGERKAQKYMALRLRCFRKLLGIPYRDHITNEEVKARIGRPPDFCERRKLKWYGHVTRSSRLAKAILQGTGQGGRQRGRQRKRWEDNIKEWTGLEWNIMLRNAENREEWRKLVVKSTVVAQRSARLRDRQDKKGQRGRSAERRSLLEGHGEDSPESSALVGVSSMAYTPLGARD